MSNMIQWRRRLRQGCVLALLLPIQLWAQQPKLTQGSLFIGQTDPVNKVIYDNKPVMVDRSGQFLLGFGRNAELEQSYVVQDKSGKKSFHKLVLSPRKYNIQRVNGVEGKYVTPPKSRLERIRNDNRQIGEARAIRSGKPYFKEGFVRPSVGPVTGVYGSQRYFNGKPRNPHYGLDYAAPTGTKVVAPASGTVVLAHPDMYFSGGTIIIDHGMGLTTSFLHLSKLDVKVGDKVVQGNKIGEVGATGRVTGPHLDWRVNWGSVRLDPALVMETLPVK